MPGKSALKTFDVVVIGELFVDEILSDFQGLPKLGEESFARRFNRDIGGGTAITACGLSRLGVNVAVIGIVGKDGAWVVDRLKGAGVNTSSVEWHREEPTGLTVSVSTREDRAFFSYYGANQRLPAILRNAETAELMRRSRHVHFACAPDAELDAALFAKLRKSRCRISLDVQSHVSWLTRAENLALMRQCDMFFLNEREGEWVTGAAGPKAILRELKAKGIRGAALKLGGKGAALAWRRGQYLCDPHSVNTVDTTGAGDSFNAGFIYGWLRGDSPQDCLETANLCGALSTRELGGIAAFPSLQELQALLPGRVEAK